MRCAVGRAWRRGPPLGPAGRPPPPVPGARAWTTSRGIENRNVWTGTRRAEARRGRRRSSSGGATGTRRRPAEPTVARKRPGSGGERRVGRRAEARRSVARRPERRGGRRSTRRSPARTRALSRHGRFRGAPTRPRRASARRPTTSSSRFRSTTDASPSRFRSTRPRPNVAIFDTPRSCPSPRPWYGLAFSQIHPTRLSPTSLPAKTLASRRSNGTPGSCACREQPPRAPETPAIRRHGRGVG